MSFRIKEKQLQGLLSSRGGLSHYSINRDWFLGFVEAEGSFIGKGQKAPNLRNNTTQQRLDPVPCSSKVARCGHRKG